MAKTSLTLATLSLLLISLISLSTSFPAQTIVNAVDTLSNSGYIAMSLTLQLTSNTLLTPQRRSATVFSPPDAAFSSSGQPSIAVLQLHFVPVAFTIDGLKSLPYGTKIPTFSSAHSLTVTTADNSENVSLNNVNVTGSPIYDDGALVIFGVERFFDIEFTALAPIQSPNSDLGCVLMKDYPRLSSGGYSFREASGMLRSRGYAVMASFLDLQLLGFLGEPKLTVFAPVDELMIEKANNFADYYLLFLRHVVPCKLTWTDLANVENGTELHTYLEGFNLNVTRSDDLFMVNEVEVTFPDMFYSDWLVVHGVRQILSLHTNSDEEGNVPGDDRFGGDQNPPIVPHNERFGSDRNSSAVSNDERLGSDQNSSSVP
ncbi:putative fasciclin-like arabinogalactan protein 20 [Heracleum sosnowskyi]|uniref:Fasciclin-like arabinogalactan protein 20 n=1 Tax=Heracleum sosnowskyi TaxID=360622 RepID=A0AAD8ISF8_9APIA|nr:putative fasciclin-like arabinogalactan protein 20 [Heracleum sosnowskyi]